MSMNNSRLLQTANLDDEMEEEEQDEEATGNPAPWGGASEHGFPAGGFSASSAQAKFFEELVKKLLKGKSKRDGDDSDSETNAPARRKQQRSRYPPGPRWLTGLSGFRS